MNITTVAVDLAKSVFQLAIADEFLDCRHSQRMILKFLQNPTVSG